ncbi:MAG: GNAT family N-acetyltransferase [Pseudomonadota bacterium]
MLDLRVAHTGDLDAAELRAARALLYDVFAGDMTEADWEHALGGMHAIAREDGEVVGHASLVMRRLLHGGRAWRAGYIEGVGVRRDRRRRGVGAAVMAPLERLIRGGYDLGALGATDEAARFYAGRGWKPWRGRTFALTPTGVERTQDEDDGIFVLPVSHGLEVAGDLICDWREGDVW